MRTMRIAALVAFGIIGTAAAAASWGQTAAPLKVYAANEITPNRYTVVKRLWVQEWRSAFRMPRHDESGPAITALIEAAGRTGADGVVNLYCTRDPGGLLEPAAFYCYGLAVKLK